MVYPMRRSTYIRNNTLNTVGVYRWLVPILPVLFFVLVGCNDQTGKSAEVVYKTWRLPVTEVVVEELPINYSSIGSIVSDQRIDIASRTTGYIREIVVKEGEQVIKGQPMILLDDADVEGAIRQARAAVNNAASSLRDAEADLERYEALFKRESVSENRLRKIRLQRDMAHDTLSGGQAALNTALSQRQYIRISSPVTGVVVARHKREGDLATPGAPILTVESSQGLLFETYVAESQIMKIRQGDAVQVNIDALEETIGGVVARVVHAGDPMTRRYLVKIALPKQTGLLSGMFGRTHFRVGSEAAPVISPAALIERGGLQGVFVVDSENHISFRWVQAGKTWDERIEIRSGLQGGERIVAVTDARLHEGDLIRPAGGADE